jgi:hypothetical protein
VAKTDLGFVALSSLKKGPSGPSDPASVLAELRRIYFKTTAKTIAHDFAHAIELLKTIDAEEDREKATVFMDGINELRKEWEPKAPKGPKAPKPKGARPAGPGNATGQARGKARAKGRGKPASK